jgi:hypothetical protein
MKTTSRSKKAGVPEGWGMAQYLRNLQVGQSFVHVGKRNGLYAIAKQARVKIATRRLPDSVIGLERYRVWRVRINKTTNTN